MTEVPEIIDFVGEWPPFDRVDSAQLTKLCRRITISYEPKGTELLALDCVNDELHLVRKGAVGLYSEVGDLVDKRGEGGLFGYPSLLTGKPTQLAVQALEDTLVYHIPGTTISEIRASHEEFDRFFLNKLTDRITTGLALRSGDVLNHKTVGQIMSSPAIAIDIVNTISDAAGVMTLKRVSALPITHDGKLRGIITDRDFRERVVNGGLGYDTALESVMTGDPWFCHSAEPALQAQLTMLEKGVHHLPVVDDGQLAGIITLSDIMRAQNIDPVYLIGDLRRSPDVAQLVEKAKQRFELFTRMVRAGVDSLHVMRIMTAVTDATTSRLVHFAQNELGPAPIRFAWICLGSEARREQTGRTDQDNGLVLESEPSASEAAYFERFADFVCTGLDKAGFVFCPGDVMAMNPKWRKSVASWQAHFKSWITEPEPDALMFASIFFDQRCVAGDHQLVDDVRAFVFSLARENSLFLAHMASNALEQRPPITFFRQFILEDDGEQHEGLNLKHRGVVPIVAIARLKALELGIESPETESRLRLAAHKNTSQDDIADLIDAMDLINRIRNEKQAANIERGESPTNLVPPRTLSPLTRRHLKAAFSVVHRAQQSIERNYRIG